MRYLFLGLCLLLTACPSVEVLQPATEVAVENQQNLEKNVREMIKLYVQVVREHPDYDEAEDEAVLQEQIKAIVEQTAISTAFVALIDAYVKSNKVNPDAFLKILSRLDEIIEQGLNVWDEIQKLLSEEE